MKEIITQQLSSLAQEHRIKILFACESGSRGWGFPSPDSDFDVRFIYTRPVSQYLSVRDFDDTLNFPVNELLDLGGWDLRKTLKLICKSNTTPFEWLQSPVIYQEEENFRASLWALCPGYYHQRANIHHYLGIAHGAMNAFTDGNKIKIKKLFYILRPLLAAKWCLEKNSIAPMEIDPLMTLLPAGLRSLVRELISLKATAAEGFIITVADHLMQYIRDEHHYCNEASRQLPGHHPAINALDEFFIQTIRQYDY